MYGLWAYRRDQTARKHATFVGDKGTLGKFVLIIPASCAAKKKASNWRSKVSLDEESEVHSS